MYCRLSKVYLNEENNISPCIIFRRESFPKADLPNLFSKFLFFPIETYEKIGFLI